MTPTQRMRKARDMFALHETRVDGSRMLVRRSTPTPKSAEPPLVLIGGTALSGRYLLPVAVELATRYPVWVPDLPGRGASTAPKASLDVEEHADYLAAWLRDADLDRVALLGNSMGCQIAVETAVRHPEAVSHVILQGPAPDPSARSLLRQLGRLLAAGPHEPTSLGPVEMVDWFRAGLRYVIGSVRSSLRYPIEARLPHVACPGLVVRGNRDPLAPLPWARQAAALLPHGQLRVVPGAGHAMVYANALELARVTDAFLQRHARGATS